MRWYLVWLIPGLTCGLSQSSRRTLHDSFWKEGGLQPRNIYKAELPDWAQIWSKIRIYMYEEHLVKKPLPTHSYTYTTQYFYGRIKEIATSSASNANLFFMPIFSEAWGNTINNESIAELNAYFEKIYSHYPYWNKDNSIFAHINHFWISAHDVGGMRAKGSIFFLNRSIVLANSACSCAGVVSCSSLDNLTGMYYDTPAYFDIAKDISTVSYHEKLTNTHFFSRFRHRQRDLTLYFCGKAKSRLKELSILTNDSKIQQDKSWKILHDGMDPSWPNSTFRDPYYFDSLSRTKFALHVHGWQPFSARLFESIASGAVPIIVAPGYVLPFEDILDWHQFSLIVKPSDLNQLYEQVSNITDIDYQRLARNVASVSHHFMYSKLPGDAFDMTMYMTFLKSRNTYINLGH